MKASRRYAPLVVGMLTLTLTLYLAFESSELHAADGALREHEALVSEQPQNKLFLAWKKVRYEKVLGNSGAQLDDYQKLVNAARDLVDKRAAVQEQLVQASQLKLVPPIVWTLVGGSPWLPHAVAQDQPQRPAETPVAAAPPDPCAALPKPAPSRPARTAAPPTTSLQDLDLYQTEYACFLRAVQIDPQALNYPTWTAVFDTRGKVNLLVSWLLPGVYGLLGACFFLMRAMLQADAAAAAAAVRPDSALALAADAQPALAAVDIMLRMAAGGLAGIIVGWFWVPSSALAPIGNAPSWSFGVAFLAGFSTDALFALLDKLLRGISGDTARPAATTPATPAVPAAPAAAA